MKYSSLLNAHGLARQFTYTGEAIKQRILDLPCHVSEKLHGENFRMGLNEKGAPFIGQRNGEFQIANNHPRWNAMGAETQAEIARLIPFFPLLKKEEGIRCVIFGELVGKGVQKGFDWPFEGLQVRYFDVFMEGVDEEGNEFSMYLDPKDAAQVFSDMRVQTAPVLYESIPLRDALMLDVDSMPSQVANNDFIEGVVIKPCNQEDADALWKSQHRLAVKHKTAKYAEASQTKRQDMAKAVDTYDSPFSQYVTEARIEHAIQSIEEAEPGTIKSEMSDLKHIVPAVLRDIEKEENDGQSMDQKDKKAITRSIPSLYQLMLNELVKQEVAG